MRGVYYTPEPVVSYIVRSIDHLLKTRFNRPDGLADKNVLILDPACGTGTFLYYVIRHIYDTVVTKKGQKGKWNSYVSQNLLKRVFGFELLMAPYAVAHLKLGLLLQELGYKFDTDERLGIYLTNTLEEAIKRSQQVFAFAQAIAEEGEKASAVKQHPKIMVVLGNPPYSGHSANRSWEYRTDPKTRKKKKILTFIGKLLQDYYKVDGKPLGEKNPKWLQDDYVKFIRFGQWRINKTGYGILAYISNHGYLDNPTFRGMRQQLLRDFTDIHVLDLHGNLKKKERAPDGSEDANVFDIQQGVAIGVFVKEDDKQRIRVHHADLWGSQQAKYWHLQESSFQQTPWSTPQPQPPFYLFLPRDADLRVEFDQAFGLKEMFPLNGVGMTTARDHAVIDFEADPLLQRAETFRDSTDTNEVLCEKLGISQKKGWNITNARRMIGSEKHLGRFIKPVLYRPFDARLIFYHDSLVWRTVKQVMLHMAMGENVGLAVGRAGQVIDPGEWNIVYVTRHMTEFNMFRRGGNNLFPLYLYNVDTSAKARRLNFGLDEHDSDAKTRRVNLSSEFLGEIQTRLNLTFVPDGAGNLEDTIGPEDILSYLYAVLHSPTYRARYADFLKIDFPRVSVTSNKKLFRSLCEKGAELVSFHLTESPKLSQFITRFPVSGDNSVEKPRYDEKKKRVYINKTQYFEGVPKDVWEFHIGGYQVCEKWLKDRKGRQLTNDDLDHYQKIVVALNNTIRLMNEIDDVIPRWPLP
jgi:predicted helicase